MALGSEFHNFEYVLILILILILIITIVVIIIIIFIITVVVIVQQFQKSDVIFLYFLTNQEGHDPFSA